MSDTTTPVLEEAAVEGLRAELRGELVQPGDEAYDEARKVYNGMIDKRPRLIARCADAADVIAAVNFARENDLLLAVRGRRAQRRGPGPSWMSGLVVDLSAMRGVRVDPKATHGSGRRRLRLERGGPRDPRLRSGGAQRLQLDHRRRRPHPWRRSRLPHPQVRPDHRQPHLRRRGPGRRQLRRGQRGGERGSVLGVPGRRRQLRRGDLVPVQGAPCPHGLRRTYALAPGAGRRGDALLRRLHGAGLGGHVRILRLLEGAARDRPSRRSCT